MISIKNLYISFTKEYNALNNVNLEIEDKEKVALVGEKESGKTTLLRVLAKLEDIGRGEVYINGKNLNKIDFKTDINVGYVPQSPVFKQNKTVLENLEYVLKIRNYDMPSVNYKILSALNNFDIDSIRNFKINQLSKYQKYLVQLARVSMRKIDLFLIDDIFSDLTLSEQENMINYVNMLIENNLDATFIFALENEKIASKLKLKVIKINNGCITSKAKSNF